MFLQRNLCPTLLYIVFFPFSYISLRFIHLVYFFFVFNKGESNPYVTIMFGPLLYSVGYIVSALRAMLISMVGVGIH